MAAHIVGSVETLSVNLSGRSVGDPSFQGWAIETLADAGDALQVSLLRDHLTHQATHDPLTGLYHR